MNATTQNATRRRAATCYAALLNRWAKARPDELPRVWPHVGRWVLLSADFSVPRKQAGRITDIRYPDAFERALLTEYAQRCIERDGWQSNVLGAIEGPYRYSGEAYCADDLLRRVEVDGGDTRAEVAAALRLAVLEANAPAWPS